MKMGAGVAAVLDNGSGGGHPRKRSWCATSRPTRRCGRVTKEEKRAARVLENFDEGHGAPRSTCAGSGSPLLQVPRLHAVVSTDPSPSSTTICMQKIIDGENDVNPWPCAVRGISHGRVDHKSF
jgi:hypothetical protein